MKVLVMLGFIGNARASHKLFEEEDPFYCPHCHLNIEENQLQELKPTIDNLTQEITALKSAASPLSKIISPQASSPQPQPEIQSTPTVSYTNRQTQSVTTTKKFNKIEDKE